MKIGTKVKVERDEIKYPPKGTWKKYRGKTGVVTGTAGGEIGVSFSKSNSADAYFQRHELIERTA